MTRKYILTGGPGSGKSFVILALEERGEHVVREAAEDVIKLAQARGIERPWESPGFQDRILDLQIKRDYWISERAERVFIDRSFLDGLAYAEQGTEIYDRIRAEAGMYNGIFLIKGSGEVENTKVRREDVGEALELERKLREVYVNEGYKVHGIPYLGVDERTEMILGVVEGGKGR